MKSVLISIQPKWCEKIADGRKTIEVCKSAPKCDAPFKCYIYCTASDVHNALVVGGGEAKLIYCCNYKSAIPVGGVIGNGKVIGEFVCDEVDKIVPDCQFGYLDYLALCDTCLSIKEIQDYGKGKTLYGWHISDLKIYDKPKELNEITPFCKYKGEFCECCSQYVEAFGGCCRTLKRPPQSYMFVSEE